MIMSMCFYFIFLQFISWKSFLKSKLRYLIICSIPCSYYKILDVLKSGSNMEYLHFFL